MTVALWEASLEAVANASSWLQSKAWLSGVLARAAWLTMVH